MRLYDLEDRFDAMLQLGYGHVFFPVFAASRCALPMKDAVVVVRLPIPRPKAAQPWTGDEEEVLQQEAANGDCE